VRLRRRMRRRSLLRVRRVFVRVVVHGSVLSGAVSCRRAHRHQNKREGETNVEESALTGYTRKNTSCRKRIAYTVL
jgi:hypothetical protein